MLYIPQEAGSKSTLVKLHPKELHDLYSSTNTIRMMNLRRTRWAQHGGEESCITFVAGKPEATRLFGRPRLRGDDNITMDLKDIGWKRVD